MADHISFTVPGKPAYLTMLRLAIGSIADTAGFDIDEIEDVKTAMCEACKNVACHGLTGFAQAYTVACDIEPGRLEIRVTDESDGRLLERVDKPCRDCPTEGDLSLLVAGSLMNEVEIVNDAPRKTIRMVKHR